MSPSTTRKGAFSGGAAAKIGGIAGALFSAQRYCPIPERILAHRIGAELRWSTTSYDCLPICQTNSRNQQYSRAERRENHTARFCADRAICQNLSDVLSSAALASSGKYNSDRAQAARAIGTGGLIGPKLRSSLKLKTSSPRPACLSARRSVPLALSPNTIWSMGFRTPMTFTVVPVANQIRTY